MNAAQPDLTTTQFTLPPDAKFLPVSELSARLRTRIGPVEEGQAVITRPGFRVTTRLVPGPLADLITEFRAPSLIADAVSRFARVHDQDPSAMLDLAFDALATLIEARILVPSESPDASAPEPSLAIGQEFAGYEIEALIRSLEDSEVYRARGQGDVLAALKLARDDRIGVTAMLANEARVLERLDPIDSPRFFEHGKERGRAYIAMEWCDGVSIAVAAQQMRAARDRHRLHELVGTMLAAYGRLHQQGVLHGDIHPGNCMVRDDGRVVILDFGNARSIGSDTAIVDPLRAGLPQFYDPQMADALLANQLPPAANPASEQYALAVLTYLLLTGLMPIEAPAVQEELLRRIVQRPPLPFAARAVPAWPELEAVVGRALAKVPDERFPDVASFARAFVLAGLPAELPSHWPDTAQHTFDTSVDAVRNLSHSTEPRDFLWFALRVALALEDGELLAAADLLAARSGTGWAEQSIIAHLARARSDTRMEGKAVVGFIAAAEQLPDGPEVGHALMAAANILDGARAPDAARLATWAVQRLERLMPVDSSTVPEVGAVDLLPTYVALLLAKSGTVAVRADLPARLEALSKTHADNVWLWALAYDLFADHRFKALALSAPLPRTPLRRAFALLRLYQLTGDMHWVTAANEVVANGHSSQLSELDIALLVAEMKAPERAILPPFLSPFE